MNETPGELDLDSVGRSDMLSHITTSRPKAPGRRPPSNSSNNKENVRQEIHYSLKLILKKLFTGRDQSYDEWNVGFD